MSFYSLNIRSSTDLGLTNIREVLGSENRAVTEQLAVHTKEPLTRRVSNARELKSTVKQP